MGPQGALRRVSVTRTGRQERVRRAYPGEVPDVRVVEAGFGLSWFGGASFNSRARARVAARRGRARLEAGGAALAGLEGQGLHGGIRPEDLKVAPATYRNLQADVSHSEVLGNEQLITCRLLDGEHLVQVRADPGLRAMPGSRIHLDADPRGWRLFDDQGDAIPIPTPPSERDDTPVLPDLT